MPQFDLSFFWGQIFWMLVGFGFLYLMMSYLICPMLEEIMSDREEKIKTALQQAEKINGQAEKINQRYQAFLLSAEQEKNDRIQSAYLKIKKEAQKDESKNEVRLRALVRKTEQKIEKSNQLLEQKIDGLAEDIAENLANNLLTQRRNG
jgi:F-type H+-transporting ATPase subunit b